MVYLPGSLIKQQKNSPDPGLVEHIFDSLEAMLRNEPCQFHMDSDGCNPMRDHESISIGVTGSPCNPYSTKSRGKRFRPGSVGEHCDNRTTMDGVVDFYKKFNPHVGICEQVGCCF